MIALKLCGVALLIAVCYCFLSSLGAKSASVYLALGVSFLFSLLGEIFLPMVSELLSVPLTKTGGEVALVVSKALSIGYLVGMGADLCEGLGALPISRALITGGRLLIFSLCLPYLKDLISLGGEWLSS